MTADLLLVLAIAATAWASFAAALVLVHAGRTSGSVRVLPSIYLLWAGTVLLWLAWVTTR